MDDGGKKGTPLGLDPVEGDPIDLRDYMRADGSMEPTPDQIRQANADFERMSRTEAPDGFGEGLEKFFEADDDTEATR